MPIDLANVDVYGAYSKHLNLGKKRANTHGGEYWTSCPFCGTGTDRFHVWPFRDREDGPTYWCRVCGACGDVIAFIEHVERLDFIEACESLNIHLGTPTTSKPRAKYKPNDDDAPSDEWMAASVKFAKECKEILWSETGKNALAWLRERGLSDDTIRKAGLGYNPATRWDEKEVWAVEYRQDIKKVWLPRGVTIPWRVEGRLWKVSIRRPDPDIKRDRERGMEHPAKYIAIAGGSNGLYGVDSFNYEKPTVILEGEFDKLILSQVIGSTANILATGSTAKGRGEKWALLIAQSPVILVAYDADECGKKAMEEYWLKYLPHALPWVPWSNDINAMFLEGHDLQEWLSMGIEIAEPCPVIEPASVPDKSLFDSYEQCHCCHCVIPSFEGWDPELIPPGEVANYDPADGELYCKQCRPNLFDDVMLVEQPSPDIAQWNVSTLDKKSSLPSWLIPGTHEWNKQVERNGINEMNARRRAALMEVAS